MSKTEAQKKAQNKYDKEHFKILSVKMKTEKHAAFMAACKENGTTANAVLNEVIDDYIKKTGEKTDEIS